MTLLVPPSAPDAADGPAAKAELLEETEDHEVPPTLSGEILKPVLKIRPAIQKEFEYPLEKRYEIKLPVHEAFLHEVRAWLLLQPGGLREAYPPRRVNSVYLDTPELETYTDTRDGLLDRVKVRLRWYGPLEGMHAPTFEVKRKHNQLGWKLTQRLPFSFDLLRALWRDVVEAARCALHPDLRLWLDEGDRPVAITSYRREYYATLDGAARVTLDYDQQSYAQEFEAAPNVRYPSPSVGWMVVEVKAGAAQRDLVRALAGAFPFRVWRNSKYVQAVDMAPY